MKNLTAATQGLIRFAAVTLSAWAVSGAVAFADGSSPSPQSEDYSEYDALSSDPVQTLFATTGPGSASLGPVNNAILLQSGRHGNRAEIEQSGEANLVLSAQTSFHDENRAEIVQSGEANKAILLQYGDDNRYELLQAGNNNLSAATQYGDDNRFEHVQTGNNLGFIVTQYGDSTIKVTQSGY